MSTLSIFENNQEPFITISLTKGKDTIISLEDRDLSLCSWFLYESKDGDTEDYYVRFYAMRCIREKETYRRIKILMHRIVLGRILGRKLEPRESVDHINHDGLDNRRNNLRLATVAENAWNQRTRMIPKSSKYKGVSWDKSRNKWQSCLMINYKHIHLGRFDVEEDAAKAYDLAAKKYCGRFANLNFKDPEDICS